MPIITGDCIEAMAAMEPDSIDAIVTDPPYNLVSIGKRFGKSDSAPVKDGSFGGRYTRLARGFMGKEWDGDGIAFRVETWEAAYRVARPGAYLLAFGGTRTVHRMTCAIEDAGWIIRDTLMWVYAQGFPKSKASLKPAWEPIVMARKPGPLRDLAIDKCRIGLTGSGGNGLGPAFGEPFRPHVKYGEDQTGSMGRWPANVILTDPVFDGGWEGVVGGGQADVGKMHSFHRNGPQRHIYGKDALGGYMVSETYGDSGTYSRFFLIPKASRKDREPVGSKGGPRQNTHPTVKPTELMRHLVRLVTPEGGVVLDPFLGSGTTALAAEMEGIEWIGIEREAEYVAIAEARLVGVQRGAGISAAA